MCERSFCEVKDILIMGNRNFYSFLVFVIRILDDGSQMIAECGMEKDLNWNSMFDSALRNLQSAWLEVGGVWNFDLELLGLAR